MVDRTLIEVVPSMFIQTTQKTMVMRITLHLTTYIAGRVTATSGYGDAQRTRRRSQNNGSSTHATELLCAL